MDPYVSFGDVARKRLGMQAQYARYLLVYSEVVGDARWQGKVEDYHAIKIHSEDVESFVERALSWRRKNGMIA